MIFVFMPARPAKLTAKYEAELVQEYQTEKKHVWNRPTIKKPLFAATHDKCVYCECKPKSGGSAIRVEHFLPREVYPEYVVTWENLLPVCERCNGIKSSKDPHKTPVVYPYLCRIQDHLRLFNNRFYHKSEIGRNTINMLGLNRDDLRNDREEVVGSMAMRLNDMAYRMKAVVAVTHEYWLGEAETLRNLFAEAKPDQAWSACLATAILQDTIFAQICTHLQQNGVWTSEHDADLAELQSIAL